MGMDVYGKNPTAEAGEYFRRNVWGWRPLWEFVQQIHPEIANLVEHGHTNDGDGLGAEESLKLAEALKEDIATGTADEYVNQRNAYLASLERPVCDLCSGTGIRTDEIGIQNGMPTRELSPEIAAIVGRTHGTCNGCSGEGKRDHFETNYWLEVDDIQQFSDFLESSGGFEIH